MMQAPAERWGVVGHRVSSGDTVSFCDVRAERG